MAASAERKHALEKLPPSEQLQHPCSWCRLRGSASLCKYICRCCAPTAVAPWVAKPAYLHNECYGPSHRAQTARYRLSPQEGEAGQYVYVRDEPGALLATHAKIKGKGDESCTVMNLHKETESKRISLGFTIPKRFRGSVHVELFHGAAMLGAAEYRVIAITGIPSIASVCYYPEKRWVYLSGANFKLDAVVSVLPLQARNAETLDEAHVQLPTASLVAATVYSSSSLGFPMPLSCSCAQVAVHCGGRRSQEQGIAFPCSVNA